MSRFNVHAGHCPEGQGACGAIGILHESVEDRLVKNEVINLLRSAGHTVNDCTCDENTTQNGCLGKIVSKCNSNDVDYDISIHLNSGRNDYAGDQSTGGVEVWCYNEGTKDIGNRVCESIASQLGYTNRGVKYSKELYVLRKTKAPAFLIECCFVDDKDDANRWDAKKCAQAIVSGILNTDVNSSTSSSNASAPVAPSAPARETDEQIADRTYRGDFGNQPDRQRTIEAMGYNYQTIRDIMSVKYYGGKKTSTPISNVSYYPAYTGDSGSIAAALKAIGADGSYYNRCHIASKNGISGYRGTAEQNTDMLNRLKAGTLIK